MFSHNHFAEKYLKDAQINGDSIPLCAPVGSNFEGIKGQKCPKDAILLCPQRLWVNKVTVYLCLSPYTMETNQSVANVSGGT